MEGAVEEVGRFRTTRLMDAFAILVPLVFVAAAASCGNGGNANARSAESPRPLINLNAALATPAPASSTQSAPADEPYDLQFIDAMIYHHQAALKMADLILAKTQRSELKAFATKLRTDQSKEIDQLKMWRNAWYPDNPTTLNMELPGTDDEGMQILEGSHLKEMDEMKPDHLDNHFLNMLIGHHKGGDDLATQGLEKAQHTELKSFAQQLIRRQTDELDQLKQWRRTWKK